MASAVLAVPTHAGAATPATPLPTRVDQGAVKTLVAAVTEMQGATIGERNTVKQLENFAKFEFSPELRPQLKEIFGTERPFPLQRVDSNVKGQVNYVGKLAPYTYIQPNGTEVSWTELESNFSADKAGRMLNVEARWPSLLITSQGSSFSIVNMSMVSKQLRAADNVPYGGASFKTGVMTFRGTPAGATESKEVVRLEEIEGRSELSRHGKLADISYRTSIKALVAGGEQVDRINSAIRIVNLPTKGLADLDQFARSVQKDLNRMDKAAQDKLMQNVIDFGKRAVMAGAALVIDDISASYKGNTATIKGRVGFQKVVEADFKNMMLLVKKVVARIDVRVPVALIKDISKTFAIKSTDKSGPDADQQIATSADTLTSVVIGKAVSGGYAVLEKDELRSTIEIKNGKLIVNGKEIEVAKQLAALSGKISAAKPKAEVPVEPEPEGSAEPVPAQQ